MRLKKRMAGGLAATALIAGIVSGGTSVAAAAEVDCETAINQQVSVPAELVQETCAIWERQSARSGFDVNAAPTIASAWTDVGVFNTDATVASAGWPISATCLITGVITGPSTAYYVLTGIANTTGPATSTTIQCSASPAGLYFNQTLPGTTSVGADFSTTLLPGDALTKQTICSYGIAYYLVRPLKMNTNTLPCSPL
ncbi:MAG TPA: hypothetical protein VEU29_06035 [Actinomycetota bacterium]|nr:hypothetical protein [Actinomycetota bacterium]